MSNDRVELELWLVAQTTMAYGVTDGEPDDPVIWLPKGNCEMLSSKGIGRVNTFEVEEWLAIDRGLC